MLNKTNIYIYIYIYAKIRERRVYELNSPTQKKSPRKGDNI